MSDTTMWDPVCDVCGKPCSGEWWSSPSWPLIETTETTVLRKREQRRCAVCAQQEASHGGKLGALSAGLATGMTQTQRSKLSRLA